MDHPMAFLKRFFIRHFLFKGLGLVRQAFKMCFVFFKSDFLSLACQMHTAHFIHIE